MLSRGHVSRRKGRPRKDGILTLARHNWRWLSDKFLIKDRWLFAVQRGLDLASCSIPVKLFAPLGAAFLQPNLVGALSNLLFVICSHWILPVELGLQATTTWNISVHNGST